VLLQMGDKKLIGSIYLQRNEFEFEVRDKNLPGRVTRLQEKGGVVSGKGEEEVGGSAGTEREPPAYEEKAGLVGKNLR